MTAGQASNITQTLMDTCSDAHECCVVAPQWLHAEVPYVYWDPVPSRDVVDPAVRDTKTTQFFQDVVLALHGKKLLIMHADVYMLRPFDFNQLRGVDVLFAEQGRDRAWSGRRLLHYWSMFGYVNFERIPFKAGLNHHEKSLAGVNTDVGGATYFFRRWLRMLGLARTRLVVGRCSADFVAVTHRAQCLFNGTFVHFTGGSNWNRRGLEFHKQIESAVRRYITSPF